MKEHHPVGLYAISCLAQCHWVTMGIKKDAIMVMYKYKTRCKLATTILEVCNDGIPETDTIVSNTAKFSFD